MNTLQQDVERRKQLVRNISHELKTPIGVIKGYAEGLKYRVIDDEEKTKKYCTVIAEECDRMNGMVQELLNLSMLESGMFQMKAVQGSVRELIQKVTGRFEPVFIEKGIKLEADIPDNLFGTFDEELIERAINNYIVNAIDQLIRCLVRVIIADPQA
jgi:signal transduction histidine kinase